MKILDLVESYLDEEELDEWSSTHKDIHKELRKKGYKQLGSPGADQSAFLEPGTGRVLKIFGTKMGGDDNPFKSSSSELTPDQEMFVFWARYCKQHQSNPFLPKFDGFERFEFDNKTYLQIRMERLAESGKYGWPLEQLSEYIEDNDQYYSRNDIYDGYVEQVQEVCNYGDGLENYEMLYRLLGDRLVLLAQTVYDISRIGYENNWNFDLHGGNYMMRGNTPVIVDPWVL